MLRAVRYEQRYGFIIEPRTLQLMEEARPLIPRLSSERLRHELDLILEESRSAAMLSRLDELGLLKAIMDDLPWNKSIRESLAAATRSSIPKDWGIKPLSAGVSIVRSLGYLLWLSSLPIAVLDKIQTRLRLPITIYKAILFSRKLIIDLPEMRKAKPSEWVFRLDEIPALALYAVFLITKEKALKEYSLKWKFVHPMADGNVLRKRGLVPGPSYHNILMQLRAAWVDGKVNTQEQETALLEKLIQKLET
jgi:tRNA nucleotidyltransferase (CCA-adding enzyme)